MKIAALLPHVEVFGGVRRYLEIGNEFVRRGEEFTLFHPKGNRPEWLEFKGIVRPFSSLEEETFDIGLCSEYSILPYFEKLNAKKKFFYFVREKHKKDREVVKKNFLFLGNSEKACRRLERKFGISCPRVVGGVNPEIFYPMKAREQRDEFRILCYGRIYKKVKGIKDIIHAVENLSKRLSHLRLIFFDCWVEEEKKDPRTMIKTRVPYDFHFNLPQDKMAWLFSQADIFVSAEKRAGWSNTTAEAMACCLPVVCTKNGTEDFAFHNKTALVVPFPHPIFLRCQIRRLIEDKELRLRLAQAGYEKIQKFTWTRLVDKLERIFRSVQN